MAQQLEKIRSCFNKASKSYDDVAIVQRRAAEFLVNKILDYRDCLPSSILDVGAGTGCLTAMLLQQFPQCAFALNDIAPEMLEICKNKFSHGENIRYLPGDMMALNDYIPSQIYDYVVSNMALQWAPDLGGVLKFLHSKAANIFAFSTLLDGTFQEWQDIVRKYQAIEIMHYPQLSQIVDLCGAFKRDDQVFKYWLVEEPLWFNNAKEFMHYLQLLGASASSQTLANHNLRKLMHSESSGFTVTYKIFFGIFMRID